MDSPNDAIELLDLIIEEASKDRNSTISIGVANVLRRVRANLEPEEESE
jgi:hypothetical protein